MDVKKSIGNVNVLDLRKATEASVSQIGMIGNANVVLYTPETAGLVAHLSFGNLNASVEVSGENVQMVTGKTEINREYFQNKTTPEFLVIIGKLLVNADVPVEELDRKISGLVVIGKVICPQNLLGILQAKSKLSFGKFAAYPPLDQVRIGDISLDERTLQSLADHSELAVVGSVTFPEVVSNDLLKQKITRLFAFDNVRCHEENAAAIQSCLHKDTRIMLTVPGGHEWIERPVVLDNLALSQQKGRKLYCSEKVQIDPEVTPALLEQGLASLVCDEMVLCPVGLREALAKSCDLLKTRAIFYEGKLWLVENEETLYKPFLEAVDGKLTLFVTGSLTIDPEIEAKVLAEKLAKLHNLGEVKARPGQMGAIQLRLGLKEGSIEDSTPHPEEPKTDDFGIGNANYLAL